MSWDDIRYFLAVMRGGSLSAAARAAGSALDGRAAHRRAGVRARHPAVRPAAARMAADRRAAPLPSTRHASKPTHAFARAAGAAALDGVVRVSASPVFASHFLAPRLARAQRAWPALRIDLLGEMHAANLYAREADLAVRLSRPTEPGPRAGSARSRCARRRNGRTRRPTLAVRRLRRRSRKRRSTSGSPASLPGAVRVRHQRRPRSIARARPAPASRCCRGFSSTSRPRMPARRSSS